ncbi:POL-like protein [Mya arenaria]|uniref:POL-like protein n=1 Tax=Mya arenaria TaxID=6604 RepID=A0ABY7EN63_MYAAR|nr:POL-like protein [Mya arenaria]
MTYLGHSPKSIAVSTMCVWYVIVSQDGQKPSQLPIKRRKLLQKLLLIRFGVPLQVHSDLGTNFTSKLFSDMFELLQIHHTQSISQHPQSNGNVERYNRTLAVMLTMYCDKNQRN